MLGTLVNVAAIIIGGLVGILLKKGVSPKIGDTVMKGLALSVLLVGVMNALKVDNVLLVFFAMVLGGVCGEWLDIDLTLKHFGDAVGARLKGKGGSVSEGFVTGSLMYCVGAMAIVGSLESGLSGNHQVLFAKSMLDGVVSVILASTLGIGIVLSSFSVLIYQGAITLAASSLQSILSETVKADMNALGGLLLIGISLNMLGRHELKIANLLPAVFVPVLYQLIRLWF